MRGLSIAAICAAWLAGDVLGCASNNCLRALSNTKGGRNASADCHEYLKHTVTPGTSTFTRTVSVTSSVPTLTIHTTTHTTTLHTLEGRWDSFGDVLGYQDLQGRDDTASLKSIPAYASACGSAPAFSSACSCIGVSAVTVTADPESTTITKTAVRTVALTTYLGTLAEQDVNNAVEHLGT
ncbi:hypothetical protein GQ53DRAFT_759486 [Thozetella sp. PMI_491]|nr:hypothetical protein GQ53DRAFT_759486 [Thozetella sp. PMI_491]